MQHVIKARNRTAAFERLEVVYLCANIYFFFHSGQKICTFWKKDENLFVTGVG